MKTFFSAYVCERYLKQGLKEGLYKERDQTKFLLAMAKNYDCADDLSKSWSAPSHKKYSAIDQFKHSLLGVAQLEVLKGYGTHYFITTPKLLDTILTMVGSFTAAVLDVFHETRQTALVIHPPSPNRAVLVGIQTIEGATMAVMNDDSERGEIYGLSSADFTARSRLEPRAYAERLAIGLALYLRFFPSAVRDGLPEIAKHPSHYKGKKCFALSMAEELIDRSGPEPHPRVAHVRFLSSDRFVHKKNTFVIVGPTFVKGKSKVVIEVESAKSAKSAVKTP